MNEPVELAPSRAGDVRDPRLSQADPPHPPGGPELPKPWTFYRFQLVGIPLLLAITAAALFGVFGAENRTRTAGEPGGPQLVVTYPTSFRFKMLGPLTIRVTNLSDRTLGGVSLMVDSGYLGSFSTTTFTPSPSWIDDEWWTFDLGDIPPGESAVVEGEIQAEDFGRHRGRIRATVEQMPPTEIDISTFTFP